LLAGAFFLFKAITLGKAAAQNGALNESN
jgi:hypothetical protein